MKEVLKVSWKTDDYIYEKIVDSKILLKDFIESLNGKELSSFKEKFKYGFQIKVETIYFSTATR